jgi:hypothetical protein
MISSNVDADAKGKASKHVVGIIACRGRLRMRTKVPLYTAGMTDNNGRHRYRVWVAKLFHLSTLGIWSISSYNQRRSRSTVEPVSQQSISHMIVVHSVQLLLCV